MDISIVVAIGQNGEIGKDNQLLWKLSDDLKLFKKRTLNHPIIMGRKTYDSIGKALPGRINIVISQNKNLKIDDCFVVHSLDEAIKLAQQKTDKEEIFIIGGQQIFNLSAPMATKLYLTEVNASFPEADTFFDTTPFKNWITVDKQSFERSDKNEFSFEVSELNKK
jgi:dihydrofolate reductase